MPVVRVDMFEGRTREQKRKLIEAVTKAVCEAVGCPPEAVTIVIGDMPKENYGKAGKQVGLDF